MSRYTMAQFEMVEPAKPGFQENTAFIQPEQQFNNFYKGQPKWQHWSFRWFFFAIPLTVHIGQMGILAFILWKWLALVQEINNVDVDSADLSYGIFFFNYDGWLPWFVWQYLPMLVTVGVSFLWETVDVTVRRLEPYHQLSRPQGATVQDSLSLDYVGAFNYFVPFAAMKRGHTAVFFSSVLYLFSFGLLPILASVMWTVEWDDSGNGIVTVRPILVGCSLGVLLLTIATAIALWVILNQRSTGLFGDPAGLGGLASLIASSELLEPLRMQHSYYPESAIDDVLKDCRLKLGYCSDARNPYQIHILHHSAFRKATVPTPYVISRSEAHTIWLWGRTTLIIGLVMLIPSSYLQYAAKGSFSFNIYVVKALYTLILIVSSAQWQLWQRNVCILQPYYRLTNFDKKAKSQRGGGSRSAVHFDFVACPAFSVMFHAMRKNSRSGMVFWISLCSFMQQLFVALIPSVYESIMVFLNAYYEDGEEVDVAPSPLQFWSWKAVVIICWPMVIILFGGWLALMFRRRKAIMPRKPIQLTSVMMYLANSDILLNDFCGTSTMTKNQRINHVKSVTGGAKYRFGWFQRRGSDEWHVGVERADEVVKSYQFPETTPAGTAGGPLMMPHA